MSDKIRPPEFLVIGPTYQRAVHWANVNGYLRARMRPDRYCAPANMSTASKLRGRRNCALYLVDLGDWPRRTQPLLEDILRGQEMGDWTGVYFPTMEPHRSGSFDHRLGGLLGGLPEVARRDYKMPEVIDSGSRPQRFVWPTWERRS